MIYARYEMPAAKRPIHLPGMMMTRMIDVKTNFKNNHRNLECETYQTVNNTHHLFKCKKYQDLNKNINEKTLQLVITTIRK